MQSNPPCAIFNTYIMVILTYLPLFIDFFILILILAKLFSIYTVHCVHPSHCNYMTLLHQMFLCFWIKHSPPHSVLKFSLSSQKVNKLNRTGKTVVSYTVYEYKESLLTCLFHERMSVFKVWTSLK